MKGTSVKAAAISAVLTMILITFMTIYAELNTAFKDGLKGLAGHHWVAKGIIAFLFFVLSYFIIKSFVNKEENVSKNVNYVIFFTIICGLIIFIFYLYEFFA